MENITNTKGANLLTLILVFQAMGKEVSNEKIIGLKVGTQGEMINLKSYKQLQQTNTLYCTNFRVGKSPYCKKDFHVLNYASNYQRNKI
jgi:hypothetical protein